MVHKSISPLLIALPVLLNYFSPYNGDFSLVSYLTELINLISLYLLIGRSTFTNVNAFSVLLLTTEMLQSLAQRPAPANTNRERRPRYQHPKGAPNADLIFKTGGRYDDLACFCLN